MHPYGFRLLKILSNYRALLEIIYLAIAEGRGRKEVHLVCAELFQVGFEK